RRHRADQRRQQLGPRSDARRRNRHPCRRGLRHRRGRDPPPFHAAARSGRSRSGRLVVGSRVLAHDWKVLATLKGIRRTPFSERRCHTGLMKLVAAAALVLSLQVTPRNAKAVLDGDALLFSFELTAAGAPAVKSVEYSVSIEGTPLFSGSVQGFEMLVAGF